MTHEYKNIDILKRLTISTFPPLQHLHDVSIRSPRYNFNDIKLPKAHLITYLDLKIAEVKHDKKF